MRLAGVNASLRMNYLFIIDESSMKNFPVQKSVTVFDSRQGIAVDFVLRRNWIS